MDTYTATVKSEGLMATTYTITHKLGQASSKIDVYNDSGEYIDGCSAEGESSIERFNALYDWVREHYPFATPVSSGQSKAATYY